MGAVAGGLLVGRLRPRAGVHAPHPHLRGTALVAAGLAAFVGSRTVHGDLAVLLEGAAYAAFACFAGRNRGVTGLVVAGLGMVLNLGAVVVNNGTPVRAAALVDTGQLAPGADLDQVELLPARHLEGPADRLPQLGQVLAVPGVDEVVSFGDLLALVGLVDGLADVTRRRQRETPSTAASQPSAVHDWGDAPSPVPSAASQYSEKAERRAAEASEFWRAARVGPSPAHLAARSHR